MMLIPKYWRRNGWRASHLVMALGLGALGVVLTLDAWKDILHIARRDEESSHIFLVPLVVGWLIWSRRSRLRHCRPVGTFVGPLFVLLGWFFHSFGDAYLFQSLWHGGAVMLVVGCVLTVFGKDVLVKFIPVFVALMFLVPIPGRVRQNVAIPMGMATAKVTQQVFDVAGVPIERDGRLLRVNTVDVAVAEACNGMRMIFALTMVSYAFAFGIPFRWRVRGVILVVSPILAIFCNVVRMVPTVWVYGNFRLELAEQFHDLSGWIMLLASFALLLGILRLMRWAMVPVTRYTLAYD